MRSSCLFALITLSLSACGADSTTDSAQAHSVIYDGNGNTAGSVPTDDGRYANGATVVVLDNLGGLAKDGFSFDGWNSKADGTGDAHVPGTTLLMGDADTTLYARWVANAQTHQIVYDANGAGSGSLPLDANRYPPGELVTVLGNTGSLTKTGYYFGGWSTDASCAATSCVVGVTHIMGDADATLFAVWIFGTPTYHVVYDSNGATGGTPPLDSNGYHEGDSVTVLGGNGLVKSSSGSFTFAGWTTNKNTTGPSKSYTQTSTFPMGAANVTLYAIWIPPGVNNSSVTGENEIKVTGPGYGSPAELIIPPGVTAITQGAFQNAYLTSVNIPSSVASVYPTTFSGCTSLTSVTIAASVIYSSAFADCTALTSVSLVSGVQAIDPEAFSGCTSIDAYSVDASNTSLSSRDGYLFNKTQTTLLLAPTGATGTYDIPATVTSIGMYSFSGCGLTSIDIPSSVTWIDDYAFYGCSNLVSVDMQASSPPYLDTGSHAFDGEAATFKIYVPDATAVTSYTTATGYRAGWTEYASVITHR